MTATRWGLLGAGWISQRAVGPALHTATGAVLEVVGARDRARAASLTPRRGAVDSYEEVVADPGIDAVYIALSNEGHLPWALAALEAGKAVLCEKPLGRTGDEARRMRQAADACGGLLVEATWNLWHPRTARAAALLACDAIGELEAVTGAFTFDGVDEGNYRLDPTRGGGALLDVGCYPLTAAAWAVDPGGRADGPRSAWIAVDEAVVTPSGSGVDLTTDSRLRVAGVPVHVRGSFIEAPFQSLALQGTRGIIEFTGNDAYTSWLQPSSLRVLDRNGERVEHFAPVDPYRLMIEQVSAAVQGVDAWLPDPAWSIVVADAMDAVMAAGTSSQDRS